MGGHLQISCDKPTRSRRRRPSAPWEALRNREYDLKGRASALSQTPLSRASHAVRAPPPGGMSHPMWHTLGWCGSSDDLI